MKQSLIIGQKADVMSLSKLKYFSSLMPGAASKELSPDAVGGISSLQRLYCILSTINDQ